MSYRRAKGFSEATSTLADAEAQNKTRQQEADPLAPQPQGGRIGKPYGRLSTLAGQAAFRGQKGSVNKS